MRAEKARLDPAQIGYLLCLAFFGLTVWSFYPGLMSPDTLANLADARSGEFHDINSPAMALIWRFFENLVEGPGLMFIVQNLIFWSAIALIARVAFRRSKWLGFVVVVAAILPHILSQLTTVWKDVWLAAAMLMSSALILKASDERRPLWLMPAVFFLFLALVMRLNALPAVLPIALWIGFMVGKTKIAGAIIGLAGIVVLSLATYAATYALTDGRTTFPFQQVMLYDLAAISKETNEPLFPEYVTGDTDFSFDAVKPAYNERSVGDLIIAEADKKPILKLTYDPVNVDELRSKWCEQVLAHPLIYLRHRSTVFAQLIGLRWSVTAPFWEQGFAMNPVEYKGSENVGYRSMFSYFKLFRRPAMQTFGFRALVWLAAALVAAILAFRKKFAGDWAFVAALSSSALLYAAAYFPTTPSTEFRYLFWPAVASAIAIAWTIFMLKGSRPEERRMM